MGTLFNQEPRRNHKFSQENFDDYMDLIKYGQSQHKLTIDQSIEVCRLLEMRRANNLSWDNGDIHDEQLMGIGELMQAYGRTMEEIKVILDEYLRNA